MIDLGIFLSHKTCRKPMGTPSRVFNECLSLFR